MGGARVTGPHTNPGLAFGTPVVRSTDPRTIAELRRPEVRAWLLERTLLRPVAAAVAEAMANADFDVRGPAAAAAGNADVAELLRDAVPDASTRLTLSAEVGALVSLAARVMAGARLTVRLELSDDGLCPVFHEDTLDLRLLCTLAGPGTEWVHEDGVDREELGLRGRSPARANAAIVPDPRAIEEVPAPHVVVLKGAGGGRRGVVHRSPARRGRRLLVVVDGAIAHR